MTPAPWIEPQAVELAVEGVIAGVRVQGIVDLLDMEGRIIDFKTAARRPRGARRVISWHGGAKRGDRKSVV